MKLFSHASEFADNLDTLAVGMIIICGLVTLSLMGAIVYFCLKFHASRQEEKIIPHVPMKQIEYLWISGTLTIFMLFFFWASHLYKQQATPFNADYHIYVFAKQWMWKFQHDNGFVEVNELHLPRKKKIQFIMISQDVIHSFFLPHFRIKQDVLPEVYASLYLRPLTNGSSPIFCAEYCGSHHSRMRGQVTVMNERDYLNKIAIKKTLPLAHQGKLIFQKLQCSQCHHDKSRSAPILGILKDETQIRKAIFYPKGTMPSFKNQMSEEEMMTLIKYIKQMEPSHGKLFSFSERN